MPERSGKADGIRTSVENIREFPFTRDELIRHDAYLGSLAGICQRLGLSGRGTRDQLIRSILKLQKGGGRR